MRGYECYYYHLLKDGTMEMNYNMACWAGIKRIIPVYAYPIPETYKEKDVIYISRFRDKETKEYIEPLVALINKVTPCSLVSYKNAEYIKYQILDDYDKNLILLNFIRNLWHSPAIDLYSSGATSYSLEFFKEMVAIKDEEDAIKQLTTANKKACTTTGFRGGPGHSNCQKGDKLVVKTTKQLMSYKGGSTAIFLTGAKATWE